MVGVLSVQAGVQWANWRQNDLRVDAHRQRFVYWIRVLADGSVLRLFDGARVLAEPS